MSTLTIYGDFNCPYSALASVRADTLLAAGAHEIDWRAVEHDPEIPAAGKPVVGKVAAGLADEIREIAELSKPDAHLHLVTPPVLPNTAAASAGFAAAGADADQLRRRLYAAVWSEGRNLGDPAELDRLGASRRDHDVARRWQHAFGELPQPVTPTMVLPDGRISLGVDALTHLAELVAALRASGPDHGR